MEKLGIKLGLEAQDKTIKFTYNIEENIGDVEMFLVLATLKSIDKGTELKNIIASFTKGIDNDQYILFENKFKKLFEEDSVKSFDDYTLVEKRANEIKNRGSMIHDVFVNVNSTYFKIIDKYRIDIKGKEHYISKESISSFLDENLRSFFSDVNHGIKNPKFDTVNTINDYEESRVISVSLKVNSDFNRVFIGEEEFTNKEIVLLAKKEVKDTSIKVFNDISKEEVTLKEIEKISDKHRVLMDNPLNSLKVISIFDNFLSTKEDKDVTGDHKEPIKIIDWPVFGTR